MTHRGNVSDSPKNAWCKLVNEHEHGSDCQNSSYVHQKQAKNVSHALGLCPSRVGYASHARDIIGPKLKYIGWCT